MAMKYDPIMCMMVPDTVSIKDSAVNEYEIHYTVPGKSDVMVGSGKGSTEAEAKADFMSYHKSENPKITSVKFYKKVSDVKMKYSNTIDKAIKACDVNKEEGFKIYNATVRNDTLYIEYEDLLYGNGKREKESFTRTEAKKLLNDPWNTWLGTSKMVVKQFAG